MDRVVIGADIGTTSAKAVAFAPDGSALGGAERLYELAASAPGRAEQDPEVVVRAALDVIGEAAGKARGRGAQIAGLSFSGAMHGLLGLDGEDRPLTPLVTWADGRAAAEAERLRELPGALALHGRTGTPLHPMSPLPKLVWFAEREPALFARVRRWVGIKELVLARLTGEWVVDHSTASAAGLLDQARLDWDVEALAIAGIDPGRLPRLVPATQVLALTAPAAAALGLDPGVPVVAGATDGPLANVGVGAVRPGVAACSIGTSGALRVMVESPGIDPLGRVFCYALTPGRWVVGGAVNNGGVVLRWAGDALAPDLGPGSEEELLDLAAGVGPGSGGLIMLPYLLSERAPHWSAIPRGAYVGLTRHHGRAHLVRAALEGVCLQLALVLHSMRAAGNEVREIRATGGFARSPLWRQLLTDVLGMEVGFTAGHQGSSFGAALLGMQALGLVESVDVAADLVRVDEVLRPEPAAEATYQAILPVFASLFEALTPAFLALRRLDPLLAPPDPEPLSPASEPTA